MGHVLISAAHKSSGKTTLCIGLCAAFAARGRTVFPFKKGPDYIDPLWLSRAAGRSCHNLDFNTMTDEEIFAAAGGVGDGLGVIEGNKGLYDGLDLEGANSNAALAKLLGAPVILVIDARGMTRGIAPLILGYQAFDPEVRIAGVILNRLGGSRHEAKLRAVIEHYTDVPVMGAVHRAPELEIDERHLGLVPANEAGDAPTRIAGIRDAVAVQVDLDAVASIASHGRALPRPLGAAPVAASGRRVRIGIARDEAFGFYYPNDLEALARAGARLIPVDTLKDAHLPALDGMLIGGGFPEMRMAALEANTALRHAIREAIEAGLPVYAECGGLMYLARSLHWRGERREMVGALPADVVMHERPQGRGYVRLRETGAGPWAGAGEIAAHEFHYSTLENLTGPVTYAYRVLRGNGVDGKHDGIVYRNTLASYAHLRDTAQNRWAARFVEFVRAPAGAARDRPAAAP